MIRNIVVAAIMTFCTVINVYAEKSDHALAKNNVTAEIQAGIEKHVEEETQKGKGYFNFSSEGKDYRFKLVRVHTEYLANLGPKEHFACVDLVHTDGNVYDVDFFLNGEPDNMKVTQTIIHKFNGIPYYTWEQNKKGTWDRIAIKEATPKLLGVLHGKDAFQFLYRIKLPNIDKKAKMWVPYPQDDSFQEVKLASIKPNIKHQILKDSKEGNKVFYFELDSKNSEKTIDIVYNVKRKEKGSYKPKSKDWKNYLQANKLGPIDGEFKEIAEKVTQGKKGDLVRARAIYDHVLDHMRYAKFGEGWGQGDAIFACDIAKGNCTDFHAYFISLARAADIPARFAIGASIPSSRNDGGISGYHCWAEFYAEGKWWPVDISEADKYSSLSTYYFGHNPANRIEFSRGRDLVVQPSPASGPINFLAYPVLEIDGKQVKNKPKFFFFRKSS